MVKRLKPWEPEQEVTKYVAGSSIAVASVLKALAVCGAIMQMTYAFPRSVLNEKCPRIMPLMTGHPVNLLQGYLIAE